MRKDRTSVRPKQICNTVVGGASNIVMKKIPIGEFRQLGGTKTQDHNDSP